MAEYVTIPLDIEGVKVDRVEVTDNGDRNVISIWFKRVGQVRLFALRLTLRFVEHLPSL